MELPGNIISRDEQEYQRRHDRFATSFHSGYYVRQ